MERYNEFDNVARIDAFHDGYFAHKARKPLSDNPHGLDIGLATAWADGWNERENDQKVVVVMPHRPEGYYHMPVGSFD